MPLILTPELPAFDLRGRLARLRSRMRTKAVVFGGARLAVAITISFAVFAWLDFGLDAPPMLRAAALLTWLCASAALAHRWVFVPWHEAESELHLALSVERNVPGLHDAFASAIEFDSEEDGSAQLRDATFLYATQRTRSIDLDDLAGPARFGRTALLGCFAALLMLGLLHSAGLLPLARFFDPLGNHPWPTKTQVDVSAPAKIMRGEPFDLAATIVGVIPEHATLQLALSGAAVVEQAYALTPQPDGGRDELAIRLEPARVPRSFRFRISANDAATPWQAVEVLVPPQLVPLGGRASPLVHLDFPKYTGLTNLDLPDGAGAVEAVLGTVVGIRAATDQPLTAAAIAYRPNEPRTGAALALATLALANPWSAGGVATVSGPTRLTVDSPGRSFGGEFVPLLNGNYELIFAASGGPPGRRPLDVRVLADPSPNVTVDAPTAGEDGLELLANAAFTLRAVVTDPLFAVRAVEVSYRTRADEPWRNLPWYDGEVLGRALSALLTSLPNEGTRLRPNRLTLERHLSVSTFRHGDGNPLAPGDVLTIAVTARDFDDVSPTKAPGRSAEIELRIVSKDRLEGRLHKSRAELIKGLKQLDQLQRGSLAEAAPADAKRRASGDLTPAERDTLARSASTQAQVLERLGDERDGLRGEARRWQQALADNPGSSTDAKANANNLVRELDRLSEQILRPVPGLLEAAQQEAGPVPPVERDTGPLPEAVKRQTDALHGIQELIEQLEAGGAAAGLAAEAANLSAEQELLRNRRDDLAARIPAGADPAKLPDAERKSLNDAKEQQAALGRRAAELGRQLDRRAEALKQQAEAENQKAVAAEKSAAELAHEHAGPHRREAERARDKAESLNREAESLSEAGQIARGQEGKVRQPPLGETMNRAAEALGGNRLGEAQQQQQQAAGQLERLRSALQGATQPDLDRLSKERKRAEQHVNELVQAQEKLQDRTLEAENNPDRLTRKKRLEELEREQKQLADETREAAREINRQGQPDAAQDLESAARQMDRARDQLASGETASSSQDDALERLDDAARQAQQARAESEERLRREAMIKLAERVKGLAERQAALSTEGDRLFTTAKASGGWSRAVQKSLTDLGRDQEALGTEVTKLAEQSLTKYPVFRRIAEQAAAAMAEVNIAVEEVRSAGLAVETLETDRATVRAPQELARKRLGQLQSVLQPPKEVVAKTPPGEKPAGEDNPEGQGSSEAASGGTPPPGDGVPPLAELKLLRELQVELRDQVDSFLAKKPDAQKWTEAERAALSRLRREQAELAELFIALTPQAPEPESKK